MPGRGRYARGSPTLWRASTGFRENLKFLYLSPVQGCAEKPGQTRHRCIKGFPKLRHTNSMRWRVREQSGMARRCVPVLRRPSSHLQWTSVAVPAADRTAHGEPWAMRWRPFEKLPLSATKCTRFSDRSPGSNGSYFMTEGVGRTPRPAPGPERGPRISKTRSGDPSRKGENHQGPASQTTCMAAT